MAFELNWQFVSEAIKLTNTASRLKLNTDGEVKPSWTSISYFYKWDTDLDFISITPGVLTIINPTDTITIKIVMSWDWVNTPELDRYSLLYYFS